MSLIRTLSLRATLLAATVLAAAPAGAATIVQTFTNSQISSFSFPAWGVEIALAGDSFFTASFLPFVGSGLTSAVYAVTDRITGSTRGAGGWGFGLDGVISLNAQNILTNTNSGGSGGGQSFNLPSTASRDLLTSPVGTSAADVIGTANLVFTHAPATHNTVAWGNPVNLRSIGVTVETTQTLTYTFEGEGALYGQSTAMPEPLSIALFGMGVTGLAFARRQRRGAAASSI